MTDILNALKRERWSAAAFGIAGFAVTLIQVVAFHRLAGHSDAERAAFGYALSLEATAGAVLFPTPEHLDTVGGYLQLRAFSLLAVLFASWALLSATRSGAPRPVVRSAAFALAAAVAATAACAGVLVGVALTGETIGTAGLFEAGLLLVALAAACYALCMVVTQLTPAATLVAGALLTALYFLNSLSRVFTERGAARWLSPFSYYDLSSATGLAVLIAIAVAATGLAAFLSRRPSRAATMLSPHSFEPSRSPLLAVPVTRALYPQRYTYAAWCVAFVILGVVLVAAARASMRDILSLPRLLPGLRQYLFVFYAQVLGQTWFQVTLLLLVALVFAFVAGWAAQDGDGRLEAQLSATYSRSAVVLERLAALACATTVFTALSGLAVVLTSLAEDLTLDIAHVVSAVIVLVVFSVMLGGAGSLLTSWAPRVAPALFGGFVLASYLDNQVGAALGLPGWAQTLSPFRLVGAPLANGIHARNLALMLLLAVAGLGTSILLMQRRDVGTSSPAYQR